MSGGGGGVNYVPYDNKKYEAAFSAAATKIKDETTYKAYESALLADVYSDINIGMLDEGLGLISNVLKEQTKQQSTSRIQSERSLAEINNSVVQSQTAAKNVTDSLLSYLSRANERVGNIDPNPPTMGGTR